MSPLRRVVPFLTCREYRASLQREEAQFAEQAAADGRRDPAEHGLHQDIGVVLTHGIHATTANVLRVAVPLIVFALVTERQLLLHPFAWTAAGAVAAAGGAAITGATALQALTLAAHTHCASTIRRHVLAGLVWMLLGLAIGVAVQFSVFPRNFWSGAERGSFFGHHPGTEDFKDGLYALLLVVWATGPLHLARTGWRWSAWTAAAYMLAALLPFAIGLLPIAFQHATDATNPVRWRFHAGVLQPALFLFAIGMTIALVLREAREARTTTTPSAMRAP